MWPFSSKKHSAEFDPVCAVAAEESRKLGHNFVGTEHLLCALVVMADPSLQEVIRRYMLNIDAVRTAVTDIDLAGKNQDFKGPRPLTPRLKAVLFQAEAEQAKLSHLTVACALLLALVEAKGVGTRSLKSLQIDLTRLAEDLRTPA